jgi:hydrogenase expression/formation protein HypE
MDRVLLGHGSGGKLMHDLIRDHIGEPFGVEGAGDSAIVDIPSRRLAYTTDSYVVNPLFFPGGNIGDLAVNGTVNDLAMVGAEPLFLTAGFIIEEGLPIADFDRIVASMAFAAKRAGVRIVAGDTKVVNRGKADGIFINTSGLGVLPEGRMISASNIRSGDRILISGELGCHGIAVMAERNGLAFEPPVLSDSRALNGLVTSMFEAGPGIHFMRDPTRGGLATTLKEVALESELGLHIREGSLPIPGGVRGACGMLGLDPLYVANEGVLVAIVAAEDAEGLVAAMRDHEYGRQACIIGEVRDSPRGLVLLETDIGGRRIIDMLQGELLPRIC